MASPPAFSDPKPGTSIAMCHPATRAARAAETAAGAAHNTAAPARTITTRCRLIGLLIRLSQERRNHLVGPPGHCLDRHARRRKDGIAIEQVLISPRGPHRHATVCALY